MSLSQGLADGESESGSLDSPTGFGKDVVDRFMAGYGHDKAAARKAMQRTYVRSPFEPHHIEARSYSFLVMALASHRCAMVPSQQLSYP